MDGHTARPGVSARVRRAGVAVAAAALTATACGVASGTGGQANEVKADGPVKVGFFAPESGFAAADGASAYNAAKLAVAYVNDHGGLGGRQMRLVNYDDASDAKQAVTIATKLVTQDRVAAVVSGSYSDQTLAAAPIFQRNKTPMLTAYAVNPGIPRTGDYIFQQDFSGGVEGAAGAAAVKRQGGHKVAIVGIDADFGKSMVDGFKKQAAASGLTIVSTDYNQFGEKDFAPVIARAISKGADSFYLIEYAAEGQQFIQAWNAKGLKLPLVSTEGIDSTTQFFAPLGTAADGLVFTTALNRDSADEVTRDFVRTYRDTYGNAPDMVAATTYDAFLVLQKASAQGTGASQLREGVAGLRDFHGVTGVTQRYTADGMAVKPVDVSQVTGGQVHHLATIDDPSIIQP